MSVCVCSNECAKTAIRRATQTTEDYRKIRPTSWAARFRLEMRCFQENEKKNYSNVPQRSGKQHSVWYANIAIRALLIRLLCANKHYLLIYLLTALQFWADVKYLRIAHGATAGCGRGLVYYPQYLRFGSLYFFLLNFSCQLNNSLIVLLCLWRLCAAEVSLRPVVSMSAPRQHGLVRTTGEAASPIHIMLRWRRHMTASIFSSLVENEWRCLYHFPTIKEIVIACKCCVHVQRLSNSRSPHGG